MPGPSENGERQSTAGERPARIRGPDGARHRRNSEKSAYHIHRVTLTLLGDACDRLEKTTFGKVIHQQLSPCAFIPSELTILDAYTGS